MDVILAHVQKNEPYQRRVEDAITGWTQPAIVDLNKGHRTFSFDAIQQ